MNKKKLLTILITLCVGFTCVSCKKKTTTESTEETVTSTTECTTVIQPSNNMAVNPVTGIQNMDPENANKRSVAIVMNNSKKATPQKGISKADAIYEYETEGGQTRLLCLFADVNTIPEIGSLRSARILSSDLAAGTNSIFVHYGRNERVPEHVKKFDISDIDGNTCSAGKLSSDEENFELPQNTFFWRDKEWASKRAIEHTAVTNSKYIIDAIDHFKINLEGESKSLFNFVPDNSIDIANGEPCSKVNVFFSEVNKDALFEYDKDKNGYFKSQYGAPQMDQTNDEQVFVNNVVVLYANIKSHGDTTIDAFMEDGGNGYYFSQGKYIPITWTKPSTNEQIKIFNSDGQEVKVNSGKTYICIANKNNEKKITIDE